MNIDPQPAFSRRSFLRGGALGAAAVTTLGLRPTDADADHEGTYSKTPRRSAVPSSWMMTSKGASTTRRLPMVTTGSQVKPRRS